MKLQNDRRAFARLSVNYYLSANVLKFGVVDLDGINTLLAYGYNFLEILTSNNNNKNDSIHSNNRS